MSKASVGFLYYEAIKTPCKEKLGGKIVENIIRWPRCVANLGSGHLKILRIQCSTMEHKSFGSRI